MDPYDENDDDDDDLQRLIEGRDYEDDQQEKEEWLSLKKSVENTTPAVSKKAEQRSQANTNSGAYVDDDQDDALSQKQSDSEEDDETTPKDDEAIEVPAKKHKKENTTRAKRIVVNPKPKLDINKLKSVRGVVALTRDFNKVNFKGKGHEKDDLNSLMAAFEHWAHRLMPNMSFDDVIEKCEQLGNKRQIDTFMKKLRIGDPLDIIGERSEFVNDEEQFEFPPFDGNEERIDPEAAFDKIMEEDNLKEKIAAQNSYNESVSRDANDNTHNVTVTELSEEQLKIIEEKRLKAIELRKKRLQSLNSDISFKGEVEDHSSKSTTVDLNAICADEFTNCENDTPIQKGNEFISELSGEETE